MVDDPTQLTFRLYDDAPYTDAEWKEIKRLWVEELQISVIVIRSGDTTNTTKNSITKMA